MLNNPTGSAFGLILFLFLLLDTGSILAGENNTIFGKITDKQSEEPVPFAYIHIEEIHRSAVADAGGLYELTNIPRGEYSITVHRIGYKTQTLTISVGLNETNEEYELMIELTPTLLSAQSIEVTGESEFSSSSIEHASKVFMGSDLRRELGATLSQTLSNLPGFDQRTNGTAPGRPVIRGLGDERLLILQDGIASGDVSAQSSDHAVTVDPVSAREIEIARGPAAFAYGANAIGGVVNVVQNHIQSTLPAKTNGTFTLNGETVNTGTSGALTLNLPVRSLAVTLDLNARYANDTQTPAGPIENSYFRTTNDAIGVSLIRDWGHIGGSFITYLSNYGVPPDPRGHPSGVDIEMRKFQYTLKGEYIFDSSFLKTIDADLSVKNYNHEEIESSGTIGTEFGLVTSNLNVHIRHHAFSVFNRGRFGVTAQSEDYAVFGAATPASNSYDMGFYLIEEADFGAFHIEAGGRMDFSIRRPDVRDPGSNIGDIRQRSFQALSGSLSAFYSLGSGFTVGSTLLRSFRAPSLEELYSEGPHLASYTFEIGNPDLEPERGLGTELFLKYEGNSSLLEATVYHNGFENYLYAQDTGRRNNRFPSLNDFQFLGVRARLYGFELFAEQQINENILIDGSVSYTIGESRSDTGWEALPLIPPLKLNGSAKYVKGSFEVGSRVRFANDQNRTGEFETVTAGYTLLDAFAQYRFSTGNLLHTVSFNVNNITDERYLNHLSIIKDLRPEPGRNISLLYRVFF